MQRIRRTSKGGHSPGSNPNSPSDLGPAASPLWPQSPHLPNGQVAQCCGKPMRSMKGDLRVPAADPGTVRVSDLAGEGGSRSGEGGLSSAMGGWPSASVSSTCTSGCSFVAGTWGEEGGDTQREREREGGHRRRLGAATGSHLPEGPHGAPRRTHKAQDTEPRGLQGPRGPGHQPRTHRGSRDATEATGAPGHGLESRSPKPHLHSLGLGHIKDPGWQGVGVQPQRRHGEPGGGGRAVLAPGLAQPGSAASLLWASVSPSQGRGDDAFPGLGVGGEGTSLALLKASMERVAACLCSERYCCWGTPLGVS